MKLKPYLYLLTSVLMCLLLNSCVTHDSLLNFEQSPGIPKVPVAIANYKTVVIQNEDILHINISGADPIALAPFNPDQSTIGGGAASAQNILLNGYLVDSEGMIDFPTIGQVKAAGKNLEEIKKSIVSKLNVFFSNPPIVNVRLLNFRINVNGEVGNPGIFAINNQSVNAIEALTMAGDFTDYSRRDSVLVIREIEGQRTFGYLDFNSSEIFSSPYFYLKQNDVIYVQPSKNKLAIVRDPINRVITLISAVTGIAAFIITLTRL